MNEIKFLHLLRILQIISNQCQYILCHGYYTYYLYYPKRMGRATSFIARLFLILAFIFMIDCNYNKVEVRNRKPRQAPSTYEQKQKIRVQYYKQNYQKPTRQQPVANITRQRRPTRVSQRPQPQVKYQNTKQRQAIKTQKHTLQQQSSRKIYKIRLQTKERQAVMDFIKQIEEQIESRGIENRKVEIHKQLDSSGKQINKNKQVQVKISPIQTPTVEQAMSQEERQEEQELIEMIKAKEQVKSVKQQSEVKPGEFICNQKAVYDYNLLVLTWVPAECYADKDCEKDWLTAEDLRAPTIHMYRPYGSSSYYLNCFESNADLNCRKNAYMTDFDFDEALRNTTGLLYDISVYWPAHKFTHDDEAFYSQQWLNHGTCYLMNMIEDNPNAYKMDKVGFNRTIMVQYFKTAINKFKKLQIDVEPGKEYDFKEQFAYDIGFKGKETHFVLTCDAKNQIVEITFCYNRSKLPGRQVTIPCTFQDSCDEEKPFKIKQPL